MKIRVVCPNPYCDYPERETDCSPLALPWCPECLTQTVAAPLAPPEPPPAGTLARAIWDARGGPAPVRRRGFA